MPLPLLPMIGGIFASVSLTSIKFIWPFIIYSTIKFLGVTLITFTAVDLLTDGVTNAITQNFNSLGTDVINILRMGGVMDAIDIITAGWVAQIQLKQIMGSFSRLSLAPPST